MSRNLGDMFLRARPENLALSRRELPSSGITHAFVYLPHRGTTPSLFSLRVAEECFVWGALELKCLSRSRTPVKDGRGNIKRSWEQRHNK